MYHTPQETFWAGEFGNEYSGRNTVEQLVPANIALFSRIFSRLPHIASLIEFGANIGGNLRALHTLLPDLECSAIEINAEAASVLRAVPAVGEVFEESILDFEPARQWDVALIKGVLIHINPEMLPQVYEKLYRSAGKFICLVEYYNPVPVEIPYRGKTGVLFKRDFAGELLDRYPDLSLVDYGFSYHRDPNFPQDDLNWFLLRKES